MTAARTAGAAAVWKEPPALLTHYHLSLTLIAHSQSPNRSCIVRYEKEGKPVKEAKLG